MGEEVESALGPIASATDEALLEAAVRGDQPAWTELVDRYHEKGIRYIRRYVDDPHLACDVMQNLWMTIVQAVRHQRPDSFSALFWTIIKRRTIDELRRRGRSKEASILDGPTGSDAGEGTALIDRQISGEPDPAEVTVRAEEENLITRALSELPDHYRLVIVARHFQGKSNRETAQLLVGEGLVTEDGNVEKRVENYYYRGLKELAKQLRALGYPGGGNAA